GVRDYVLGATLLNGRAEVLSFGGQVMKNVAGYDVSRLLAGSLGTLGVILEVSLKVLPQPPAQTTLRLPADESGALRRLNEWGGAQRWCFTDAPADMVRDAAHRAGGHATLFRAADKSAGVFTPLAPALKRIHHELKAAFDPAGIFNPGRLYPDL